MLAKVIYSSELHNINTYIFNFYHSAIIKHAYYFPNCHKLKEISVILQNKTSKTLAYQ